MDFARHPRLCQAHDRRRRSSTADCPPPLVRADGIWLGPLVFQHLFMQNAQEHGEGFMPDADLFPRRIEARVIHKIAG
jgi:hypothetical protein